MILSPSKLPRPLFSMAFSNGLQFRVEHSAMATLRAQRAEQAIFLAAEGEEGHRRGADVACPCFVVEGHSHDNRKRPRCV